MNKKIFVFSLIFFLAIFKVTSNDVANAAFVDGCKAYSNGEWISAIFSFKKAVSFDLFNNPETYFMMINAEIYSEDYESALEDCDFYLENFKKTIYESNVMYLKGRCLYLLGEYDKAVVVLSDFCHQYEDNDMYASAVFFIGECFYACYQYEDAASLYQRVVTEFPTDSKAPAAQYRLETIGQRDREEKLLYLLKQTGEEYLVAKEEYERQLRIASSETTTSMSQKLYDANERNRELEYKYEELLKQMEDSNTEKATTEEFEETEGLQGTEDINLVRELKRKAAQTQMLLNYMNDIE